MRKFLLLMMLVAATPVARAADAAAVEPTPAPAAVPAADAAKKADEKKADEKKNEVSAVVPVDAPKAGETAAPEAAPKALAQAESRLVPVAPLPAPADAAASAEATKAPSGTTLFGTFIPGLHFSLGTSFFIGVQTSADFSGGYFGLSPGASYKLNEMVTLSAGLSPFINFKPSGEYGIPDSNRRFDNNPAFSALRAGFKDLYVESASGIHVNGSVTYSIPLSYNNLVLDTIHTWGDVGAGLALSRKFGDFSASLNGLVKHFGYLNARPKIDCSVEKGPCQLGGFTSHWNPMILAISSISGTYTHGDWSGFASFGLSQTKTFGPGQATEPNNTNDHANDKFGFSFFASVAYAITEHFGVNGGLFNGGPQLTDRENLNNFLFDYKFAGVFVGTDWTN